MDVTAVNDATGVTEGAEVNRAPSLTSEDVLLRATLCPHIDGNRSVSRVHSIFIRLTVGSVIGAVSGHCADRMMPVLARMIEKKRETS